jgi:ubiquinone/menaquinone biosynthesis C-methylase UbiE
VDETFVKKTAGRTLDRVAPLYNLLSPIMLFGMERRISRQCLRFLDDGKILSILDVGCGTGTLTINIGRNISKQQGASVVGIDAASRMIQIARRKAQELTNVSFDIGIAEDLPYPDNSFDYVVSTFFFHHINYALKEKALNEIWRVLKNGRSAVIVDVDVPTNLLGKICAWSGRWLFRQDEIRENIEGEFRTAIEHSAFKGFELLSHHQGYISAFRVIKKYGGI